MGYTIRPFIMAGSPRWVKSLKGSLVGFQGMAPVTDGPQRSGPGAGVRRGRGTIGAPSTRVSLVGLRPRRARLRFPGQESA